MIRMRLLLPSAELWIYGNNDVQQFGTDVEMRVEPHYRQ
jgi:hypothetical protein